CLPRPTCLEQSYCQVVPRLRVVRIKGDRLVKFWNGSWEATLVGIRQAQIIVHLRRIVPHPNGLTEMIDCRIQLSKSSLRDSKVVKARSRGGLLDRDRKVALSLQKVTGFKCPDAFLNKVSCRLTIHNRSGTANSANSQKLQDQQTGRRDVAAVT